MYFRVYCVTPFVGSGSPEDPRRPKHAPSPALLGSSGGSSGRAGIIGWAMLESDDKQFALVEYVAADRAALKEILEDTDPSVLVFEKGRHSRAEIGAVFKQYRKNFDFAHFGVIVP
jgi:hypothetical protein